jgi:hypothetical protein
MTDVRPDEQRGATAGRFAADVGVVAAPRRVPEARPEEPAHGFRGLVSPAAWAGLPPAVQRRFARHPRAGRPIIYRGEVVETTLTQLGRLLANLARIIGAPLPLAHGATGPALVIVSEGPALGDQQWTRLYARPGRFPQVIHSAKRFAGPTGLEEHLGFGLVMQLATAVVDGALVFRSAGYAFEIGGWRLRIPGWLSPGQCEVMHRDAGEGRFVFGLALTHPVFGRLVRQTALFTDPEA